MDIKTNMVLGLFKNNSYFKNLKEYLTEKMENKYMLKCILASQSL